MPDSTARGLWIIQYATDLALFGSRFTVHGPRFTGQTPMLAALLTAIRTLTRIPVPGPGHAPDTLTLGRSAVFYPLVGALLGLLGIGIYRLLIDVLPANFVILLLLAVWTLVTGGLHEDGLADVFDAFGSQTAPEGIHRVLKDSRIGAYGVLALVFAVLLRWQGLVLLPPAQLYCGLLLTQTLPRAGIAALAYFGGPASAGVGGGLAKGIRPGHVAGAWVIAVGITAPLQWAPALLGSVVCLSLVAMMAVYFRRKIGGITGDCLGAASQIQEVALLVFLLIWSRT